MINFENMSPKQFEVLSKDILEKEKQTKIFVFPSGRDGGIDGSSKELTNYIVLQAKHYYGSNFSKLKSNLKNIELPKIKKLLLKEYYLFTTLKLTRKNKEELIDIMGGHLKDLSYIYAYDDIVEFLNADENVSIYKKHNVLWMGSTNFLQTVLNQSSYIDSIELKESIRKSFNTFVYTNHYYIAEQLLERQNILIITGNPGVGKTTLSNMLILKFLSRDYKVTYVSNNELSELKSSISMNDKVKEIILLDDFLGEHYVNLKSGIDRELKSLFSYVKNNQNKKLILNSRITIYNDAKMKKYKLNEILEEEYIENILINIDKVNNYDKAKIFVNHLRVNKIPVKHVDNLVDNKNHLKIITHENYNPRIIEHVTKNKVVQRITHDNYSEEILKYLDNSVLIWKEEFYERIEDVDRIFMFTLYSLNGNKTKLEYIKTAFNNRISKENKYSTTTDLFNSSFKRLNESFLRFYEDKDGEVYIDVLNPSVNDFLRSVLINNELEQKSIIESASYIEQIDNIVTINSNNIKYFDVEKLLNLENISKSKEYYFLDYLLKKQIKDEKHTETVKSQFEKLVNNYIPERSKLYKLLIVSGYFQFYRLENVASNNFMISFKNLEYKDLLIVVKYFENNFKFNCDNYYVFRNSIIKNIEDELINIVNSDFLEIVFEFSNKNDDLYNDIHKLDIKELIHKYEEDYIIYLIDYCDDKTHLLLNEVQNFEIEIKDINYDELISNLNFELLVDELKEQIRLEYEADNYRNDHLYEKHYEESSIENLFKDLEKES